MSAINTSAKSDTERGATIFTDIATRFQLPKADGAILAHRLVQVTTGGEAQQATFNSTSVIGVNPRTVTVADNSAPVQVGYGRALVVADGIITAGQDIKAAGGGKVTQLVTTTLAGTTIEDNVGLGFANQPANDGVEMVSDNAADTTQTVTLYYTRTGQGNTVYTEGKTLNGTTQVTFTDTDVALVLAIVKSAATAGTLTVREASGNATIKTLNAATNSSGYIAVTAGQTYAYNTAPSAVGDAATTKTVGIIGTDENGATLYASIPLTGATPVLFPDTFQTVTYLLVGDLEAARTVTVKVGSADSLGLSVGKALQSSTAAGQLINAYIAPARAANLTTTPVAGVAANFKVNRGETALDGSNPTSVAHGLTTCVAFTATLKGTAAPGLGTSTLTANINGANVDVYAWKPTGAGDTTLIASTGVEVFYWTASGF